MKIGLQTSDGKIQPCNYYQIRRGDFVDVIGTLDVVTPYGNRDVTVRLALVQVIQLKAGVLEKEVRHML